MPSISETASTFGTTDLHFQPLLRFLEDSARQLVNHTGTEHFYPRITVDEHALVYELYADLPGAQASDVTVEAHETHAVRISGTTHRLPTQPYNSKTLVAGDPFVQVHHGDTKAQTGADKEKLETYEAVLDPTREQKIPLHRAENRGGESVAQPETERSKQDGGATLDGKNHGEEPVAQPETERSKQDGGDALDGKPVDTPVSKDSAMSHPTKKEAPINRRLIEERQFGEFHRSFRFPSAIMPNDVTASLENGVLRITVPKDMSAPPKKVYIHAPPPYGGYIF